MGRRPSGRERGGVLDTDRTRGADMVEHTMQRPLHRPSPKVLKAWIAPVVGMVAAALLVFAAFYTLDLLWVTGVATAPGDIWAHYATMDPDLITDALPALGMTIVAVLGIVLTVVAIIVQLSSDRYTGVALMFLRDPVNIAVMSYYVLASLCAVWLSVSLHEDFVPKSLLFLVMGLTSVGLAIMLPYFAYVFWFLEPGNIIDRIRYHTSTLIRRGLRESDPARIDRTQQRVLNLVEEITDIANNSIDGKDKIVTGRAVDALRDLLIDYIGNKPEAERPWFRIGPSLRENPDFVAMDIELMNELELRWLWVEWKTMRQYLGVYNEAIGSMQDINYLIAIDTRYIGEAAADRGDTELIRMVLRFMNSYMRSAINQRSTRAAYNVLHQYRMLIEALLRLGHGPVAREGVAFLKYYGHTAFEDNQNFVTETVAFDLAALCKFAHRKHNAEEEHILRQFLDLDRPTRGHRQERGLRGVRKAQAKLAAYYISVGAKDKAQLIADDMVTETADLLHSVRDELARVETAHFWEIVDRGHNFDYLPPEERAQLGTFFSWLDAAPPPRRRSTDR
jgi:hypothetical protein